MFNFQDTCEFAEAIKAMEEMMKLKEENPVDLEALSILIKYAIEDIKSGKNDAVIFLRQFVHSLDQGCANLILIPPGKEYLGSFIHNKLNSLLSKIEQKVSDSPKLWNLFADYACANGHLEKAVRDYSLILLLTSHILRPMSCVLHLCR
jgi:hypothetical protein